MTESGAFVTVDGPGGVGKSTVTAAIASELNSYGITTHTTREPSDTTLGNLARHGTEEYRGMVMACLVAADRFQHLDREIRPALARGQVVLCDRYVAASLVLQRMDGIDRDVVWELNRHTDRPDLSVVLTGDADVIAERLNRRGAHSRYERMPGGSHIEHRLYSEAVTFLGGIGVRVLELDTTRNDPANLARTVVSEIVTLRNAATT